MPRILIVVGQFNAVYSNRVLKMLPEWQDVVQHFVAWPLALQGAFGHRPAGGIPFSVPRTIQEGHHIVGVQPLHFPAELLHIHCANVDFQPTVGREDASTVNDRKLRRPFGHDGHSTWRLSQDAIPLVHQCFGERDFVFPTWFKCTAKNNSAVFNAFAGQLNFGFNLEQVQWLVRL